MLHPINWWLALPYFAAAFAFGYLLGSIPFGLLVTRLAGTQDIRTVGSGNIGATNVLRTGRKGLAAATLIGDALKGTAAVWLTYHFFGQDMAVVAALGAFIGHLFPVWLKFKGGKGVATFIGILVAMSWQVALAFGAIWIVVAYLTRYSSLSGLVASAAVPVIIWWLDRDIQVAQLFLLLAVLLWFTHRANIMRIVHGTESRIGESSAPKA